jgi:hypothetical protein
MIDYDPHKNPDLISLVKQPDGNWTAEGQKFGKYIKIRGAHPHAVLEGFLISSGQKNDEIV